MVDVLKQLRHLSWRDIEVPCYSIEGGFQHESVDHKYLFRDNELIESLGRRNLTVAYKIPFREDLFLTPQPHLFTSVFPRFFEACQDRSQGPLVDPILGDLPAKVTQFRFTVDVNKRDGIDVDVEFVHAPDADALPEFDVATDEVESAKNAAKALDSQAALVDWKQEPPPEPFLDPFSAISSVFDQTSAGINKAAATLDKVAFQIDKTNASIEKVADVRNWPVRRAGNRLKASCQRTKEKLGGSGRRINLFTVPTNTQRGPLAALLKNTLGELITLNPPIAQAPLVRGGTTVRYYAS